MSPAPIILFTLVLIAVIVIAVFMWLRGIARQREQSMLERFPNARLIVPGANFFGQQSKGATQLRGNGTLVITDTQVVFEGWMPRREFIIPISRITGIETPNSFLGKTVFTPVLKVVYHNEAGQEDAMAWFVQDLSTVKSQLEQALH